MKAKFQPHITGNKIIKEFSLRATILGLILGLFFAVANAYLALKVGTTISASIPAAILSMGIFKIFFKNGTILENNIVQTIATIGEGLAAGVVFTIPALMILGETPSIGRIFLLSFLGGILGVLLMIPMRRFLIVEEHHTLPFPEGTGCAEILKAGQKSSQAAIMASWGVLTACIYKICSNCLFLWKETYTWTANFFKKTELSIDGTPALLGVGYIIGPYITGVMFAGGLTAWWVLIPLIKVFAQGGAIIFPATLPIDQMSAADIWDSYVRYIGAGTLAVGGLMSLFKLAPLLYKTIHLSVKELFSGFRSSSNVERTDRDISMGWLILGSVMIILILWLFPGLPMNFLTICLLVVLAFFFVGVTSVTVGLVGSTSNPVSGMTIMTLLVTCLVFVMLGWTERIYLISAITMGCVACCAICIAGTTAQDLKTGFLLGATPKSQQLAEMIGAVLPALALGYVIYILNSAYQIGSEIMPAPQASLISMIAKGVLSGSLPYAVVGLGVAIGIVMAILRIPIMPFALGVYLPLSLTAAMMVGGLVKAYVNHKTSDEKVHQQGMLLAAGLIGGDASIGIILAILTVTGITPVDGQGILPGISSLIAYLLLGCFLAYFSTRKKVEPN
ncbi:MAG: oligopeptide transporter, OPT family [Chlamydiia bacterium]|nr:oligopeptide transporter, OPT family [Chlamydiia bacterium]